MVSAGGAGLMVTSWGWFTDETTGIRYRLWRVRAAGRDLMGLVAPSDLDSIEALVLCYEILREHDDSKIETDPRT